jgi:hypothetical protein
VPSHSLFCWHWRQNWFNHVHDVPGKQIATDGSHVAHVTEVLAFSRHMLHLVTQNDILRFRCQFFDFDVLHSQCSSDVFRAGPGFNFHSINPTP